MPPPGLFQKHYKHAVQCSESLGESSVTWGFRGDWLGLTTLSVCLTTFDNAFSVCLFICSLVLTKGAFRSCKHYSHYSHYSLRFLLAHSLVANESIWPSAGSKSRLQQRWLFFVASCCWPRVGGVVVLVILKLPLPEAMSFALDRRVLHRCLNHGPASLCPANLSKPTHSLQFQIASNFRHALVICWSCIGHSLDHCSILVLNLPTVCASPHWVFDMTRLTQPTLPLSRPHEPEKWTDLEFLTFHRFRAGYFSTRYPHSVLQWQCCLLRMKLAPKHWSRQGCIVARCC